MRRLLALLIPLGGLVLTPPAPRRRRPAFRPRTAGPAPVPGWPGPLTRSRTPGPGGGKPTSCPPDR